MPGNRRGASIHVCPDLFTNNTSMLCSCRINFDADNSSKQSTRSTKIAESKLCSKGRRQATTLRSSHAFRDPPWCNQHMPLRDKPVDRRPAPPLSSRSLSLSLSLSLVNRPGSAANTPNATQHTYTTTKPTEDLAIAGRRVVVSKARARLTSVLRSNDAISETEKSGRGLTQSHLYPPPRRGK